MDIQNLYKTETGRDAHDIHDGPFGEYEEASDDYVLWLEEKLENFLTLNGGE